MGKPKVERVEKTSLPLLLIDRNVLRRSGRGVDRKGGSRWGHHAQHVMMGHVTTGRRAHLHVWGYVAHWSWVMLESVHASWWRSRCGALRLRGWLRLLLLLLLWGLRLHLLRRATVWAGKARALSLGLIREDALLGW